jgi:DnaJ-class molecular chaperone
MDGECEHCNGTGMAEPKCAECEGMGWVTDPEDGGTMNCPTCENEPCDECDGTGESAQ